MKYVFLYLLVATIGVQAQRFQANLDSSQIIGSAPNSSFTGTATFEYRNNGVPELTYQFVLLGMDLDGNRTPGDFSDDVTAIHVHFGSAGATGPHALNVYGLSAGSVREDDMEMTFNSASGTVMGRWDDSDQVFTGAGGTKQPFDSVGISGATTELFNGDLYVQVHTLSFPNGELRGQMTLVPEPGTWALLGLGLCVLRVRRGGRTRDRRD
ncbi:MAG: CHRD domain-containing protein [Limisphaerales bacterium]